MLGSSRPASCFRQLLPTAVWSPYSATPPHHSPCCCSTRLSPCTLRLLTKKCSHSVALHHAQHTASHQVHVACGRGAFNLRPQQPLQIFCLNVTLNEVCCHCMQQGQLGCPTGWCRCGQGGAEVCYARGAGNRQQGAEVGLVPGALRFTA